MRQLIVRFAMSTLVATLPFAAGTLCGAQTAAAVQHSARVVGAVDSSRTVQLHGHVPAFADERQLPSTAIEPTARFAHLTMVLSRAPQVEAAFEQLMADQLNPSSPRFHQWLTPAQVGTLYGPAQADVDAVTGWLQSRSLTVNSVSPNRLFVDFSGPVASVSSAFGTRFKLFSLANGEQRYSLMDEPAIPAALQPVISTVAGLSQAIHHPTAHKGALVTPQTGAAGERPALNSSGGGHYLVSGDFAVAYDINPVYAAGITGSGQNIAVAGLARVNPADISALETYEGLTVKQANVIIPSTGADPGAPGTVAGSADNGDQDEATLDVDRSTSTAPGATIDLVVSGDIGNGDTYATSGLYIAINYAISTVNDPILSISFGGCEALNGSANDMYEQSLFQTAAAQGISTFISAGDSGAAACNAFYSNIPSSQVLSINDLCANQYVTCMGGTEFADSTNASTYWSSSNGTNKVSLLSYIPEGVWNDVSASSSGIYSQGATGGGVSVYLPKPSWQTGTGVPAGSFRWIPDVSLTSSTHDGFATCLIYENASCGSFYPFGGTSAAAPSMAGIQALVNQKLGGRQGNVNPTIYLLASTVPSAFHDVTVASSGVASCSIGTPSLCNNSTPTNTSLLGGLAGYQVTAGYDPSTGWGSLDVAKYIATLSAGSSFSIAAVSSTVAAASSGAATDTITLTSLNGFAGTVALSCSVANASGSATGSCTLSATSVVLTSGSTGTTTLKVSTGSGAGSLNVMVAGTSGSTTEYANVVVTVGAPTTPTFTIVPASAALSFASGATSGNSTTLSINSLNGFAGTVGLTCTLTSSTATFQPTCAVSPTGISLSAGGSATATLTIGSTTARSAALKGLQATASLGWQVGGGAMALLLFCIPFRRRRFGTLAVLGCLALSLSALSGCSGNSDGAVPTMQSSAGTYTVTVSGTGTPTGSSVTTSTTATVAVTIR